MDDQLRREVLGLIEGLAAREKERLASLRTFADIEELTAEIGDEFARQLAGFELSRRAKEVTDTGSHACPDCGRDAPVRADPEPLILEGDRGEIEYSEPACYCPHCRVSFFPSGARTETPSS